MDSVIVEAQKVSDIPSWLVRMWTHHGKGREIVVDMGLWVPEYPDLLQLIEKYPGVDAYPHRDCLLPDGVTPAACDITIKPTTLEALRALPTSKPGPKTNRTQATVNGFGIDLRSTVGLMLYTTSPANLADACKLWLADLRLERKATARRKVRILLERAVGIRGEDLDPILKREIMEALTTGEWRMSELRERERGIEK